MKFAHRNSFDFHFFNARYERTQLTGHPESITLYFTVLILPVNSCLTSAIRSQGGLNFNHQKSNSLIYLSL